MCNKTLVNKNFKKSAPKEIFVAHRTFDKRGRVECSFDNVEIDHHVQIHSDFVAHRILDKRQGWLCSLEGRSTR
jgi:hypothetical protein